jgi:hypothetical protein
MLNQSCCAFQFPRHSRALQRKSGQRDVYGAAPRPPSTVSQKNRECFSDQFLTVILVPHRSAASVYIRQQSDLVANHARASERKLRNQPRARVMRESHPNDVVYNPCLKEWHAFCCIFTPALGGAYHLYNHILRASGTRSRACHLCFLR